MFVRCTVRYSRAKHAPITLGIEGAQCELHLGHSSEHETTIVVAFGETPTADTHEKFRFRRAI